MILGFRYDHASGDASNPVELVQHVDNRAAVRWMNEPLEHGESRKCYIVPEPFNTTGTPPEVLRRVWGIGKRLLRDGGIRAAAPQTKEPQGTGIGGRRSTENAINQIKAALNEPGVRDQLKNLLG